MRDGLVKRLVKGAGEELAMASEAPVEGHLFDGVHEMEPRPRPPVAVLAPSDKTGYERPHGSHVVVERVVQVAFGGEHTGTPVRGHPVARELGQRGPGAFVVKESERGCGGGPYRKVVVGSSARKYAEGVMRLVRTPVGFV